MKKGLPSASRQGAMITNNQTDRQRRARGRVLVKVKLAAFTLITNIIDFSHIPLKTKPKLKIPALK